MRTHTPLPTRRVLEALLLCGASMTVLSCPAPAQEVAFRMGEGRMEIRAGELRAAAYVWDDPGIPRPYFAEITAPNGVRVTRNHPPDPAVDARNDDHATFHPGVWLAFGDINGADFWRNRARVRHARFTDGPAGGDRAGSFEVLNVYETSDTPPRVLCEERARYTFRVTGHGYLLECESLFTPKTGALLFGDQEEMGFGVRLATPLTVKHGNGRMLNSAGGRNEDGTWGKRADWCAGMNRIDGVRVGAVVMASPRNFRESWFHSRDYGLIVANPFGRKAMTAPRDGNVSPDSTRIPAGETLRLGFAAGFFSTGGDPNAAVEALYAAYLAGR